MGYDLAIQKAWDELSRQGDDRVQRVRFLGDEYSIDLASRKLLSLSCNAPAKDFYAILILHYAARWLQGLPAVAGQWLDFREVSHVEGYGAAFRNRCIAPVLRKYGKDPAALLAWAQQKPYVKKASQGDAGIIVEAFDHVPVLITLWKGDEEFGPDANMLFDSSITRIFCTEDVAVLGQIVAGQL